MMRQPKYPQDGLKIVLNVQPGYGSVPYAMFVIGKLDDNIEQNIINKNFVRDDDEIES